MEGKKRANEKHRHRLRLLDTMPFVITKSVNDARKCCLQTNSNAMVIAK